MEAQVRLQNSGCSLDVRGSSLSSGAHPSPIGRRWGIFKRVMSVRWQVEVYVCMSDIFLGGPVF